MFIPFVHLPSYEEERGIDPVLAAGLVGAIGTASVVGRLALGGIAATLGLMRVFQACYLAIGLRFGLWWVAGSSYAVMLAFAIALGIGYGGFVALGPAVVAARFGVPRLGSLLCVLYTAAGVGSSNETWPGDGLLITSEMLATAVRARRWRGRGQASDTPASSASG